jgi:hypothetical protein
MASSGTNACTSTLQFAALCLTLPYPHVFQLPRPAVHIRADDLDAAEQDLLVCSVGTTLLQTAISISVPLQLIHILFMPLPQTFAQKFFL